MAETTTRPSFFEKVKTAVSDWLADAKAKRARNKKEKSEGYNYNKFNQISPAANIVLTIFMVLLALVVLYPVVLLISISFTAQGVSAYHIIPERWSLVAYQGVIEKGYSLWVSYAFTIFRTVVSTVWALFLMSMYAYVLVQRNFKGHKFFTYFIFLSMIFSAGTIPSYLVNSALGLKNTIWIMILPGALGASWVIMLRTFLKTTVPEALYESARIDGASNFRVYASIVMPLFKPGLATIGLFKVVGVWNEWFTAILYIDDTSKNWMTPLATLLQRIQRDILWYREMAKSNPTMSTEYLAEIQALPTEAFQMAITVVATLPIMFAYPFFQRYFIEGLTIGSVKE